MYGLKLKFDMSARRGPGARTKPQEGKNDGHEDLTWPPCLSSTTHHECIRRHRRVSLLSDCDMDTRDFAVLHTLGSEA
jgi:hypothetical protein